MTNMITATFTGLTAAVDPTRRRITGLIVPYGETGHAGMNGEPIDLIIEAGGITWDNPNQVKLVVNHTGDVPVFAGKARDLIETPEGIMATFAVAKTTAGDDLLVEAAEGLRTGLSIEASIPPTTHDGTVTLTADNPSKLHRVAAVETPAFENAQIHHVAAQKKGPTMTTETVAAAEVDDTTLGDVVASLTNITEELRKTLPQPAEETEEEVPTVASQPVLRGSITAQDRPFTPGQYLYAAINQRKDPDTWARYQKITAAATLETNIPGIVPDFIWGPEIITRPTDQPAYVYGGAMGGPSGGKTFHRPVISDPIADAVAATEVTDVTDVLGVTAVDVTYSYIKRSATLSGETVAFTSPAVLEVAARDLLRAYARGQELIANAPLNANADTPVAVTSATCVSALTSAAATMYSAVGQLPDAIICSPAQWAIVSAYVDSTGRPLFPMLNPVNAEGQNIDGVTSFTTNVLGLNLITSWAATTSNLIARDYFETYGNYQTTMQSDNAAVVGVSIARAGACAGVILNAGGVTELAFA